MTRVIPAIALGLLLAALTASPASSQHADGGHAPGAPAAAPDNDLHMAAIGFDAVRPARLDVLTGDTVRWTNTSARTHTVTADDESFDSGRLGPSTTYLRRFDAVGEWPYHCQLHPLIRGVVGVHDLLLEPPGQAGVPNRPLPLAGRAALPAGTPVTIEADRGAGYAPVDSAEVGDDGHFGVRLVPTETASYRAVAGGLTSDPVSLLVLDRSVALTVRPGMHGRVQLHATVTPASVGGRVVLQVYLPERFGWWPVQQAELGSDSAATFTLRPRRRLRARVHYTLPDGATTLASSRTVRIGVKRSASRRPSRARRSSPTAPAASHHARG